MIIFSSEESAKNLFVVLICHVISLLMIFCGKDTNLFSNFKILTKKNDQKNRRDSNVILTTNYLRYFLLLLTGSRTVPLISHRKENIYLYQLL